MFESSICKFVSDMWNILELELVILLIFVLAIASAELAELIKPISSREISNKFESVNITFEVSLMFIK